MAGKANHCLVYAMEISPVYVDVEVQRFTSRVRSSRFAVCWTFLSGWVGVLTG